MKPEIKSGVEYAVIALLSAGLCLWMLIAGGQEEDASAAKLALAGIGLIVSMTMHCVFMMQLVRRTGRSFWPWFVAVVIFMPVGSAVLLATFLGDSSPES